MRSSRTATELPEDPHDHGDPQDAVAPAVEAATVALLRDSDAGLEVLLLRRTDKAGFVPGAHVFAGGAVDASDSLGTHLVEGVTDAAVALFLEKKRAPEQQSADWLVLQEKTLFRGLEALSEALGEKPWFLGNSMTLADVACGCTLGYLNLRFPEIDWRMAHPNLARLADTLATRASFKQTVPVV